MDAKIKEVEGDVSHLIEVETSTTSNRSWKDKKCNKVYFREA